MSGIWDAIDATWAAPRLHRVGPFTLREGQGGGQRVSAATTDQVPKPAEIAAAAQAMRALGQRPLFMVRGAQRAFDAALEAAGYEVNDPVIVMEAPIDTVARDGPPPVSAFPIWPPLQIMQEIWAEGGIGPERLAIMAGSCDPKTAILGRVKDRAAGCAFVAIHAGIAVMHAVEVSPALRRMGTARNMARGGADWARRHGATRFAILTVADNAASQGVFTSLGMVPVEHYHYRRDPNWTETP
ncbi:GNAT family N-acetyltransferase [Dinoroseobacter sp. PD6]|uniref:GNAT family N-acetyltransferase n=1 Tax=Dinoroseobacter sp. PD6 TaxID=3028384 RepID=UPI00237C0D3C|nr:GNAT family N-acetyltransferase [Dinoroseobacter sp. PD6]MDD9717252.1 GNAT family N-acetyltransferase [Dinoroseobacter sp. PD6]